MILPLIMLGLSVVALGIADLTLNGRCPPMILPVLLVGLALVALGPGRVRPPQK